MHLICKTILEHTCTNVKKKNEINSSINKTKVKVKVYAKAK